MGWPRRAIASALDLVVNSGSMMATTGVTSVLGAVYWWVAAHEFPAREVGLAGALVSAMTLLGVVSTVGFSTALFPELADPDRRLQGRRALVLGALLAVAGVGAYLGTVWQAVMPRVRPELGLAGLSAGASLFFGLAVALTALTLVLDQALIGLLWGGMQLFRNAAFALVKLLLLGAAGILLRDRGAAAILATWVMGNLASLLALAVFALVTRGWGALAVTRPRLPPRIRGVAVVHHVFNLALSVPAWILPLLATTLISATANAYFYTAWTVAAFVAVGPLALTTVLYAVAAQPSRDLGRPLRLSLLLSLLWSLLASGACALFGSRALGFFGHAYGTAGPVLLILALATFPQVVKLHYVALVRLGKGFGIGILVVTAGGVLELGLAAGGAIHFGLRGLAGGYLAANLLESLVVLPAIVRALLWTRGEEPEPVGAAPIQLAPEARPLAGPWERWGPWEVWSAL